jgi:biotin transport system permease protein
MISFYRPGTSPLHLLSVGWKLLSLTVSLLALAIYGKNLTGAIVGVIAVIGLYQLAGIGLSELLKQLWRIKFLVAIVALPQLIFNGIVQGAYNSVAVIVGVLLASLMSLTTKTADLVDLLQRITRSRSFALLIALSINSIALVLGFSNSISEASLARGVKPNPVRQIVTLFVVSLRYADDYAEALAARGVKV